MDKFELQKLRDLPIEGVAGRLGLEVVRHKCLCPFHDDHHASLSFSVRRNTYRCFACGAHGGVIDLAMGLLNKPFLEACKWLADEHNVIITDCKPREMPPPKPFDARRYARYFERPWLSPEACKFLFDERRLNPAVVRYCRLNSFRDWLQIPYFNRQGELIGIQRRYMGSDPSQPRFRFPAGSECGIYNLPVLNLLKPGEELWITEGCSDCWSMLSAGHKAIAIPSATLLTRKDMELLSTFNFPLDLGRSTLGELSTKFHMYPDCDEPGERLFLQLKQVLPNLEHHQLPPGCKDFSDYYLSAGLAKLPR
jgi:DNA primase